MLKPLQKQANLTLSAPLIKMTALKIPELAALKANDQDAWNDAYDWLWPVLLGASHARLGIMFPAEVEEVAVESFEEIYEKRANLSSVEEVPDLAQDIADKRAISRWRKLMAKKRGSGKVVSLDAISQIGEGEDKARPVPAADTPHLDELDVKDLRKILITLQQELKAEFKQALNDLYIERLSYEEISQKRGWPVGSVGVYVSRGLKAMREQRKKYPRLVEEAMMFFRLLFV